MLPTDVQTVRRIPWTSWDPPLVSTQTQAPMLSGGSLDHPGILPWSPLRHRPPCCPEDPLDIPGSFLGVPSDTGPQAVRRIPWTSRDPPLVSPQTQAPMLSGGSLGHPGILPWCPLRHRPPCCPEDPLDIPGSSLGLPLDTVPHAVQRIPWTSRDPPLVSPPTQAPMLSGGSLGHPGILPWCPFRHRPQCCPEDPLDIPGSSLGLPSDTGPHAVRRIPWTSRDPPLVSPQTQAPMLSGGSLGHPGILPSCPLRHRPPCCPEHPLDIPGSSLGLPSDTGPHAVRRIPWTSRDPPLVSPQTQAPMLSGGSLGHPGILPWCPLRHRPPCCPEDPLDIPGSSLGVPSETGPHAVRRIPWTSRDPPLVSPQTQAPMLSGGSLVHPGILPRCPLRHRPPCCPEDPLDIPGSSLGLPSDTVPHAVRRMPWTSRDPPLVSPQTQAPMLSGGSLGHPGILPWCPFRHRLSIGYSSIIS